MPKRSDLCHFDPVTLNWMLPGHKAYKTKRQTKGFFMARFIFYLRLGRNQKAALRHLYESKSRTWSPVGIMCGWVIGNQSRTVRILDSLVYKGLVSCWRVYGILRYGLTIEGRRYAEKKT